MSNLDRRKILLVEDFDDARELYSTCLRSFGYDVIEAATGTEAVALARSASPDGTCTSSFRPARRASWR